MFIGIAINLIKKAMELAGDAGPPSTSRLLIQGGTDALLIQGTTDALLLQG